MRLQKYDPNEFQVQVNENYRANQIKHLSILCTHLNLKYPCDLYLADYY